MCILFTIAIGDMHGVSYVEFRKAQSTMQPLQSDFLKDGPAKHLTKSGIQ